MKFHINTRSISSSLLVLVALAGLQACGGGGGSTEANNTTAVTSFELLDPTPGEFNQFGQKVIILASGNIIISDPYDSSIVKNNGAIHLYNPLTRVLISSIYGTVANESLGNTDAFEYSITALANGNFVVASREAAEGGVTATGSVRLYNGSTGLQIGATLAGDV